MDGIVLGRAHGAANVVGGLWPLLHIRSFEMVLGPKTDRWLVKTVAGLLIVNGITQLTTSSTAIGLRQARRLGVGTAAVLAAIDLVYVPARRISKMYLVDAAIEVGWIIAWYRVDKPPKGDRQQLNSVPPGRAAQLSRGDRVEEHDWTGSVCRRSRYRLAPAAGFGHLAMLFGLESVGHHLVGRLHGLGLE